MNAPGRIRLRPTMLSDLDFVIEVETDAQPLAPQVIVAAV